MQDNPLHNPLFETISAAAEKTGCRCYVIGGYVRDCLLQRKSNDIDIVCDHGGIELAHEVKKALGKHAKLSVFKNFGTAQVVYKGCEIEFVGARKESYRANSRKPIVENGTMEDDQKRRDFTINTMSISLDKNDYGRLIDPFGGIRDLDKKLIRTPTNPDKTFSDDPLRMLRAIRFATQLDFRIDEETFEAIGRNRKRINIVSTERITTELNKILLTPRPSTGFKLLEQSGLLEIILPEIYALKGIDTRDGKRHKDIFLHSLSVVDNIAAENGSLYLRWAALLHDIGKAGTKHFDEKAGWTFHNHDFLGEKMVPRLFKRLKMPLNENMRYVQKIVGLHMRPIALVEDNITDSAVRRLLFEAGDDIDDLMLLCKADITTRNESKQKIYHDNLIIVEQKLKDIEQKDHVRNFKPPIDGTEIMNVFNIQPCNQVGIIKNRIKNAILDGKIPNEYDPAYKLMLEEGARLGLYPKAKNDSD